MGAFRGGISWEHFVGAFRGSISWEHFLGAFLGSISWEHFVEDYKVTRVRIITPNEGLYFIFLFTESLRDHQRASESLREPEGA